MWAVTRYDDAKAMLTDPRLRLSDPTYLRLDVPEYCRKHLRTMQSMDGAEHTRLRRLVSPAFTVRRAERLRPRIAQLVDTLLDDLDGKESIDLLADFARPLPIDVICELVGIQDTERAAWREYGHAIATGNGAAFTDRRARDHPRRDRRRRAPRTWRRPARRPDRRARAGRRTDRLGRADHPGLAPGAGRAGPDPPDRQRARRAARHPDQFAALRADESTVAACGRGADPLVWSAAVEPAPLRRARPRHRRCPDRLRRNRSSPGWPARTAIRACSPNPNASTCAAR